MLSIHFIKKKLNMFKDDSTAFDLSSPQFSTDLHNIVVALSDALDYISDGKNQHSKRVAMMAIRCAEQLGWGRVERYKLFELGLLHDIGLQHASNAQTLCEATHLGTNNRNCIKGYQLLEEFAPLSHLAWPTLYLHNSWPELQEEAVPDTIKQSANLIQLTDFIDVIATQYPTEKLLLHTQDIIKQVRALSGSRFSPKLVESFCAVAQEHSFWLSFHPHVVNYFVHDYSPAEQNLPLSIEQLKEVSLLFSHLVDSKSHYTAEHSACVGLIARYLGELKQLPLSCCQKLEIAGYLHDLGTLRVNSNIINKKGALTETERTEIQAHVHGSLEILDGIVAIEDIRQWISFHHERLDGSGYPYQPKAEFICIEARILAIADVFQALCQDRPYRQAFNRLEIVKELNMMARTNQLDDELVSLVCLNFNCCYELATQLSHTPSWWHNHTKQKARPDITDPAQ